MGGEPIAAGMLRGAGSDNPAPLFLRENLRRGLRRRQRAAAALVAPLFVFTLLVFIVPLGDMLRRSVWNAELAAAWPTVRAAMGVWRGEGGHGVPTEAVFAALAQDLRQAQGNPALGTAARRLNYDLENGRSLVFNTA